MENEEAKKPTTAPAPTMKKRKPALTRAQVARAATQCASYTELARKLDRHPANVRNLCKKFGIELGGRAPEADPAPQAARQAPESTLPATVTPYPAAIDPAVRAKVMLLSARQALEPLTPERMPARVHIDAALNALEHPQAA